MGDKPKVPKDLGVKIGSKTEVIWTKVHDETEALIEQYEDALVVQKGILGFAKGKITIEKEKFK